MVSYRITQGVDHDENDIADDWFSLQSNTKKELNKNAEHHNNMADEE